MWREGGTGRGGGEFIFTDTPLDNRVFSLDERIGTCLAVSVRLYLNPIHAWVILSNLSNKMKMSSV